MMDKSQESYSWGELAEFTHQIQIETFNWCSCEEQEYFPYKDCPREGVSQKSAREHEN
jgi:hypothetical protein